jgi:DNA repair exonuclease SbcCD ATPase subunit
MDEVSKLRRETIEQVVKEMTVFRDETLDKAVEKVAIMREETFEQLIDRLSEEREKMLQDFLSNEGPIKELAKELGQTLNEGHKVLVSLNTLSDKFGTDSPMDIKDYQETLLQAKDTAKSINALVKSTNLMLNSSGWEKLPRQLSETLNELEEESKKIVDHTFRQAILLILIWLLGYVAARLLHQYLSKRFSKPSTPEGVTGN